MSKGQTLRALVNKRLAAAAEEIFVLFERTMAGYEEELCRCKEENQRKQQLLDQILSPRIEQVSGNVHIPSTSRGRIKEEPEEQSVKQEEEQLPVCVPECSSICVKTEESSALLQNEETQGEEVSFGSDTDDDDNWGLPTKAGGDKQVQIRDRSSSASPQNLTAVLNGDVSGADGAQGKKHPCPFCQMSFRRKNNLERHIRVHTGERPYSCTVCKKTFAQQSYLDKHIRTHTGEKPHTCSECHKTFARKTNLTAHKRRHTGEKPYSCAICKKTFAFKSALNYHRKTHTGEKPYSCTFCDKFFVLKSNLDFHIKTKAHKRTISAARSGTKLCNPQAATIAHRAHGNWSQSQQF